MLTDNFGIFELLTLAALAYASYVGFTQTGKDGKSLKTAGIILAGVGVLMFNSAGSSEDTFATDPTTSPSGIVAANFNATELLYVVAIGYAAWILFKGGQVTAAIAAAVAAVMLLFEGNKSTETF